MTLLITGATGFLGSALAHAALGLGQPVVAFGRDTDRLNRLRIAGADCHPCALNQMPERLAEIGTNSTLVHCAALSTPYGPWSDFKQANVAGTSHALDAARRWGVTRFIHISSPSILFCPCDQLNLDEGTPLPTHPINHYAKSKILAEQLVLGAEDLETAILRPRGLYGPGDTALVPRILNGIRTGYLPLIRGGTAMTDLTHVDDVVAAIFATIRAKTVSNKIYHISGGQGLSVRHMAEALAGKHDLKVRWMPMPRPLGMAAARVSSLITRLYPRGREPKLTPYTMGLFAFTQTLNIDRAATDLGWTPQISFDEGLHRL